MINSNKILTVSYGTFSCTLEGFDDSFDTMKAIAEYFRDLASDDRYFGAEPPTPDAEMLARIAEREVARRVEAHEEQGKIVLRTSNAAGLTAMDSPVADVPPTEADQAPETVDESKPAEESHDISEQPEVVEPVNVEEPVAEEQPIEADLDQITGAATSKDTAEIAEEMETAEEVGEASEIFANEASEEETETYAFLDEAAEEPIEMVNDEQPQEQFDPDSIAAKLGRIRSVVSNTESPYEAEEFNEDEHALDAMEEPADDFDAVLKTEEESGTSLTDLDEQDSSDAEDASDFMAEDAVENTNQWEVEANSPLDDTADEEYEVEIAEDTLAQLMADAIPADAAQDDSLVDYQEDSDLEDELPLNARVIKMNRDDLDDAISQGHIEEELSDDDSGLNMFEDDDQESTLSVDDEIELQRDLALVKADSISDDNYQDDLDAEDAFDDELTSDGSDELDADQLDEDLDASNVSVSDESPSEQDDSQVAEARGLRKLDRGEGQSDLARIFDEADHHLEEPESHQRRNAIQHLRAAVAATRAEKKAGADLQKNVDDTPYRTDLAEVVLPRRPQAAEGVRLARPEENHPAPLKLVAEQRVDTARDPIRPRRVSKSRQLDDNNEQPEETADSGFIEFAKELGVTRLPELLEAAAAYMSDVEGRPQFSRPMLMGKLKEVSEDNFSREDGLRSFGQLLRLGKIQKLKGGRFAVTDETEFRANTERHAG